MSLTNYELYAQQRKQQQYDEDMNKDIEDGDLVKVRTGSKTDDGICKVLERIEDDGVLYVKVRRLMKPNGIIVQKSYRQYRVRVSSITKVSAEQLFDEAVKYANDVRAHLLSA